MTTTTLPTDTTSIRFFGPNHDYELDAEEFGIGDLVQFGDSAPKQLYETTDEERALILQAREGGESRWRRPLGDPKLDAMIRWLPMAIADWSDAEVAERLDVHLGEVPYLRVELSPFWTVAALFELGIYLGDDVDAFFERAIRETS